MNSNSTFHRLLRFKTINRNGHTNGSMFDFGVEMEESYSAEKVFYEDQNGERKFRISGEKDADYVEKEEWFTKNSRKREDLEILRIIGIQRMWMKSLYLLSPLLITQLITKICTLKYHSLSINQSTIQTAFEVVNCKPPRDNERVCTDDSKAVCANLSSVDGM